MVEAVSMTQQMENLNIDFVRYRLDMFDRLKAKKDAEAAGTRFDLTI
jgi:hypothetical protein